MREITIYEAEDGKIFGDRSECEAYEFKLTCEKAKARGFDRNGNPVYDLGLQRSYEVVETVEVPHQEALDDIRKIYNFTGFYGDIKELGTWKWDEDSQRFIQLQKAAQH